MAKKPTYEELEQRVKELENKTFDRKQADEALRESEARLAESNQLLAGVLEHTYMMALFLDPQFNFIWVNRTYADTCKHEPSFFPGKNHFDLYPHEENQAIFQRVVDTGEPFFVAAKPFEFPDQPERGVTYWDWSLIAVKDGMGQVIGLVFTLAEVTERIRAEEALRESEDRFRQVYEHMAVGVARVSLEFRIEDANEAYCQMLGYREEELIGKHLKDITHPDTVEENLRKQLQLAAGELDHYRLEKRFKQKNGRIVYGILDANLVRDVKGKPIYFLGSVLDINDRKQAEEALQESEKKYRSMLEAMIEPIYICSQGFQVEYMNPAMIRRTGRDATGEFCFKALHDLNEKCSWCMHDNVQQGEYLEFEIVSPKDKRSYHISQSPIAHGDGSVSKLTIFRDITEMRDAETQLQQASKMKAIATLAGGIAHEFNNALMGIMGNIELLKMDLPEDERQDGYFEAMKGSGHRMSRLTDQLLAYAQGGKYQAEDLKLDDFVIETLPILQHDLDPSVRVETHFPKDISHIKADNAQMQMVLSAILANSNEAVEDEGFIRITAENKDVDEDFAKQHPGLKPGPYVCLTIEDNGKGMNEEERKKIFEPFFTTKFQGRGMGMAAVYGIVKNHDGRIYLDSELGKGTVVRIYLPAIEAKEEVKEDVTLSPALKPAMGEGTILVIEDEEVLVEMFKKILERLGYRVFEAKTGREGVEIVKTFDGQIDLALLDIKLPDMDGGRVYPLIMEARPDLKVIVCSGYSIHGPAQDILDAGAEGFIQKPFSIVTFAEKLKEVLEGK